MSFICLMRIMHLRLSTLRYLHLLGFIDFLGFHRHVLVYGQWFVSVFPIISFGGLDIRIFFGILQFYALVQDYGVEELKGLVDDAFESWVRYEGNLVVLLYLEPFARVDVHALPVVDAYQFEHTKAFHFHILVLLERLFYQVEHGSNESLGILAVYAVLFGQCSREVLYC